MSVGLLLRADVISAPETLLERLETWLLARSDGETWSRITTSRNPEGALLAQLHPAAESVEFELTDAGLQVGTSTSTVGPGYHRALCALLHDAAAHLGLRWRSAEEDEDTGDETEFFFTGDAARVDAEMLTWLGAVAAHLREALDRGATHLALAMPTDRQYLIDAAVLTALGPRDAAWIDAIAADPARGVDFFAWWADGAGALLGRALALAWSEVPWRAPLDDAERATMQEVAELLARAWSRDPTLAYPFREWLELLDCLADTSPASQHLRATLGSLAARATGPRIGYRRHDQIVHLPGSWTIRVPGSLRENFEDGTWSAHDDGRTVWVTSFAVDGNLGAGGDAADAAALLEHKLPPGERLTLQVGRRVGVASLHKTEEDGTALWCLQAQSALPGMLAMCSIYFEDEAHRAWAIATWHSLENRAAERDFTERDA